MREDEVIIKRKQYSKTDANNRNFGRFPSSYIYSPASRLSEHSPIAAINQRGLNTCLSGRTAGERPKRLPDWTAAQVLFVMSPRGNVNTRMFSRGERQLGFRGVMAEGPVHSPLVCLRTTPATPGTLTDLGLIRDHASPRKGEYKTFPFTFCGSHC